MEIHIVIKYTNHIVLAAFDKYELALHYAEVIRDRGTDCYIKTEKVLNKLPNWAIKQLEEKYL